MASAAPERPPLRRPATGRAARAARGAKQLKRPGAPRAVSRRRGCGRITSQPHGHPRSLHRRTADALPPGVWAPCHGCVQRSDLPDALCDDVMRLDRTHLSTLRSVFLRWPGQFDEACRVGYRRYTETPLRLVLKEGKTLFASVHAVEDPCDTRHGPASHNFMCQTSWYSAGTRSGLRYVCFRRPPWRRKCNFGVFNSTS